MAFSLSSWFKGKPGAEADDAPESAPRPGKQTAKVPPPAPSAPPQAVRTVMPSSTPAQNPVSLRTPGAPPLPKPPAVTTRSLPVRPPARKVSFPVPSAASVPAPVAAPVAKVPPPAPAPATEVPDVAVNLAVGDFIDRIPPGYLQPGEFDRSRVVEFRASELYSDLAKGRASVPASTIYAKCPEVFARPVSDTEDFEVQLPLQKLVEQLSAAFTTRTDQVAEENVGEIETPFLKVAMEDSARLPTASGTVAGAVRPPPSFPFAPPTEDPATSGIPQRPAHRTGQISTISAKPAVEPPLAPSLSPPTAPINPGKRPPSTVRASVAGGKIRLSGPAAVARMTSVPAFSVPPPAEVAKPPGATQRIQIPSIQALSPSAAGSPSHQVTKKTARIQIPPISLKPGGPDSPSRSSGAIPPPPAIPVQSSPVSIRPAVGVEPPVSFRTSPPPPPAKVPAPGLASTRPSFPPPSFPAMQPSGGGTPPPPSPAPAPSPFASNDPRQISLGLAAVLRGQPASALAVEPADVPDDVRVSLPFGLVERQLSTGRVSVPRHAFVNALPESHKHVLAEDGDVPEVLIPLQEVFQNLPGNALTMRQDQVVEEIVEAYPTPFSQKAQEDAQRLGAVAPVSSVLASSPPVAEIAAPVEESEPAALVSGETKAPVGEEPFASVSEEAPLADAASPQPVDEPFTAEEAAPADEASARDLPFAYEEAVADDAAPAAVEEPVAEDHPLTPVKDVHPAEPAVEPPASVEPAPVAEALAGLESFAPGRDAKEKAPTLPTTEPVFVDQPGAAQAIVGAPARTITDAVPQDSALQTLLMTEDELDAKGVVRHVCLLPGITGCAVMFADGLRLAGNFPEGDAEGFCAMAPPFFKRTGNFAQEVDLGALQAITLYTDRGLLSFFMHDDICLSVRHTGRGFLPGVREKLASVTRELARMYGTEKPAPTSDYTL